MSITTSLKQDIPFGLGSYIVIKNEYDLVIFSGYIEKSNGTITNGSAKITFSGRDILCDLIDSTVPASVSLITGSLTLENMCDKIMTALELPGLVINMAGNIEPFNSDEITANPFGQRANVFLQKFARKRQVFLTTDGKGNLVIFSTPSNLEYEKKLTESSMLSRSFMYDTTQRYNKIIVGSEDNFAASDSSSSVDRRSEFTDDEIRDSRVLQISAEESMNDAELEGKAKEEVSIRRARGFAFTCTVPSHNYAKGKLISLNDKLSGIEGNFLIKKVVYRSSNRVNVSDLTLCFPETYEALGVRTSKRKSKIVVPETPEEVTEPVGGSNGWTFRQGIEGIEL